MKKEYVLKKISNVLKQYNYTLKQTFENEDKTYYIDNFKFRIYLLDYKEMKIGYLDEEPVYGFSFNVVIREDLGDSKKWSVWQNKGNVSLIADTIGNHIEEKTEQLIKHLYNLGYLGISADNLGIDTDKEFERIAQEVLDIETLKIRDSHSLNFHSVSVWGIKQAFQKVFDLGVDVGYSINR